MRREVSVSFSDGRPSRLKKPPGILPGGVGLFLVVDGQREEVLTGLGFLPRHRGDQHDGVVEARQTAPPAWRAISPVSSVRV